MTCTVDDPRGAWRSPSPRDRTDDASSYFATEWRTTAGRLTGMLARRGVTEPDREDIVQETALRLYRVWHRVDPSRGADAYAHTIALNVLRDELRRPSRRHEVAGDVPDIGSTPDSVERAVVARAEVDRVFRAFDTLSTAERSAISGAVTTGESLPAQRTPPAARMARMRARRRLMSALADARPD